MRIKNKHHFHKLFVEISMSIGSHMFSFISLKAGESGVLEDFLIMQFLFDFF